MRLNYNVEKLGYKKIVELMKKYIKGNPMNDLALDAFLNGDGLTYLEMLIFIENFEKKKQKFIAKLIKRFYELKEVNK